jgi:diaminopimelate decarboxylase
MKKSNLLEVVKKFGTPSYVYDTTKIKSQYNRLKNSFKLVNKLQINYAVKALSNLSILKYINTLGAGIDTVSIQEVILGIRAGYSPKKIIYTPNGVSIDEIYEVSKMGVNINIDNLNMLEQFGNLYPETPVCIRINPHVMAGGNNKISVGHIDSKFGISIHQIPLLLRIVNNTNIKVNGIHMHTGSDILDIDVFIHAAEILFETALKFENLEFIDFGSGFKVPYSPTDTETNIEELGVKLSKRFNQFCKDYGKELTLAFEPGKFMVSEAGNFLCSVNSIKQTTSTVFVQVDSGFNHFVRPMMYGSNHYIENISNPNDSQRFYSVVGYICETDTFASNRRISKVSEGDVLCFKNAGAYCFTMASNYNSRYKPAEVLYISNKLLEIRKRETIEDLIKNQVELDFNAL